MPTFETLVTFAAAAALFCIVPGPNVLYIVARTLAEGRRAGLASVLGVTTASLVHVALTTFGLSAMVSASATAYDVLRFAGAGYLVWLGIRALVHSRRRVVEPGPATGIAGRRAADAGAAYRQGFVVNLLSPKTALFFLALLPQFVDPARGAAATQLAVLGLILVAVGVVSDGLYALGAGAVSSRLRSLPRVRVRGERLSGAVYIALGVGAALTGQRSR